MSVFKDDEIEIHELTWLDSNLDTVRVTFDNLQQGSFNNFYLCNATDSAPMNRKFWTIIQEEIKAGKKPTLPEMEQLKRGLIPLPPGKRLINGQLYKDVDIKQKARISLQQAMQKEWTGFAMARATKDPVFAKNRSLRIDMLLAIDDQISSEEEPFVTDLSYAISNESLFTLLQILEEASITEENFNPETVIETFTLEIMEKLRK